jgi:hypothetical protein
VYMRIVINIIIEGGFFFLLVWVAPENFALGGNRITFGEDVALYLKDRSRWT